MIITSFDRDLLTRYFQHLISYYKIPFKRQTVIEELIGIEITDAESIMVKKYMQKYKIENNHFENLVAIIFCCRSLKEDSILWNKLIQDNEMMIQEFFEFSKIINEDITQLTITSKKRKVKITDLNFINEILSDAKYKYSEAKKFNKSSLYKGIDRNLQRMTAQLLFYLLKNEIRIKVKSKNELYNAIFDLLSFVDFFYATRFSNKSDLVKKLFQELKLKI